MARSKLLSTFYEPEEVEEPVPDDDEEPLEPPDPETYYGLLTGPNASQGQRINPAMLPLELAELLAPLLGGEDEPYADERLQPPVIR